MTTHIKNISIYFFITTCFIFGSFLNLEAQIEPDFLAQVSPTAVPIQTATSKSAYYFRHLKKLPLSYEGNLIELTIATAPLPRNYALFKFFGNVHYERLKSGKVAYYLLGDDFNRKRNIKKFIKDVVIHQAPEAKLIVRKRKK